MKYESVMLSLTKSLRSFIFSIVAVVAPYYLASLGLSPTMTGAVIVLAVVMSTTFVYIFSYMRAALKIRLMILAVLLLAAMFVMYDFQGVPPFIISIIIGGVTLSGRDLTPNQSIEKFTISTSEDTQRGKNYAFSAYNFSSYGAGAVASLVLFIFGSGLIHQYFLVDMILAALQIIPYAALKFPEAIERKSSRKFDAPTRSTVRKLAPLFSMDAIGGGLVITSVIALWFKAVYGITLSQAGLMFVIVNVVTAVSIILSSAISDRLGLVRTMVYTHIISNVFMVLVPVFHTLALSQLMLYLRQTTSQMDVPARDSFINTIIPAEHRVRSNSVFLAVRSGSQVPGPGIAGILIETAASSVFFLGGGIKILYDLLLYASYRNYDENAQE